MDSSSIIRSLYPFGIIAASISGAFIVRYIIKKLSQKATATETKLDDIIIASLGKPIFLLIIAIGFYYAAHSLPELRDFMQTYDKDFVYRNFIITIFGTWVAAVLADGMIKEYGILMAKKTEGELDDRLITLADMSIRYLIWIIGILIAMKGVGFEITPAIAGVGIAGLAVALAAQNILSNIFGGVTLTLDRHFRVGDRVKIGDIYGDVYDIRPRYTKIRTLDNIIVTIPNAKLIDSTISNFAYPDTSMRLKLPVSVSYGSDPEKVREILFDIIYGLSLALKSPAPEVRFNEFADSSLNFEVTFWIYHYSEKHPAMNEFNMAVFRRFNKEGIEIPFPQMDVHIK